MNNFQNKTEQLSGENKIGYWNSLFMFSSMLFSILIIFVDFCTFASVVRYIFEHEQKTLHTKANVCVVQLIEIVLTCRTVAHES